MEECRQDHLAPQAAAQRQVSHGETLTAEAVEVFAAYLLSDKGRSTVGGSNIRNVAHIASAKALDPLTVEIKTEVPNPVLPGKISTFWITAPKHWADVGPEGSARNPAGTGSFKLGAWANEQVVYEAFEGAWKPAKVKRLVTVSLAEQVTRLQAILSNQTDVAVGVAMDSLDKLTDTGHKVDAAPRPSVMGWRMFSVSRDTPYKDKRVCQAVNYTIDREVIVQNLMRGLTMPANQSATRAVFGYNQTVRPYTYDPRKARQLLAEAGYPNGLSETTPIEIIVGNFPADSDIYPLVGTQRNAAGIKNELRLISFADWLKKWFVPPGTPTMGFSGGIFTNSCRNDTADALDCYRNLSCRHTPAHHCNADEMKLIEAGEQEFDVEKRSKILSDLLALNSENAAMLYMIEMVDLTGLNKRVQGFRNDIQRFNFEEVTLAN
ncbi:MAG: hypothetical protein EXQ85_06915 [Alphaproteobacteria bacterium]|nr:hypothetical protein [Alphaproteobacteria bacterium]